jgi:hypothetical protein
LLVDALQQSRLTLHLPIQRIEQVAHPNGQQQDAFNALTQASKNCR